MRGKIYFEVKKMTKKNLALICLIVGGLLGIVLGVNYAPDIKAILERPSWEITANGENGEAVAPNGTEFPLHVDYRWTEIAAENETRCVLMHEDGSICILDSNTTEAVRVSGDQTVADYIVTSEAISWLNLDGEVWACKWAEGAIPILYCTDAIAIRHLQKHWDNGYVIVKEKTEGASPEWDIVPLR